MPDKKDNPGVIAPPPLIFLSGLLIGGFVAWHHPFQLLTPLPALIIGSLLLTAGVAIIGIAFFQMRKAKTNIEPWKPTTAILETGVFGYTRNPIYLAMVIIYIGASYLFNSVWFLPFLPLCIMAIHYGVILREEKYLEGKFGDVYLNYKERVRRWV